MSTKPAGWPFRPLPVHTLLFAAYPILFLYAQNTSEVVVRDVVPPLGRAVLAAAPWGRSPRSSCATCGVARSWGPR